MPDLNLNFLQHLRKQEPVKQADIVKSLSEQQAAYVFNKNMFKYLNALLLTPKVDLIIKSTDISTASLFYSQKKDQLKKVFESFTPKYDYANTYRELLHILSNEKDEILNYFIRKKDKQLNDQNSEEVKQAITTEFNEIMDGFLAIFQSNNDILENTWEEYNKSEHAEAKIATVSSDVSNTNPYLEDAKTSAKLKLTMAYLNSATDHKIKRKVMTEYRKISGKKIQKIKYQPMLRTSIPSVRKYKWNKGEKTPTEIRMGTQAQITDKREINPLFKTYLQAQNAKHGGKQITHVYINNLKFHTKGSNPKATFERQTERCLTEKLHQLEDSQDNLVLLTLPADTDVLKKEYSTKNHRQTAQEIKENLLKIVTDEKYGENNDFYMSDKSRDLCKLNQKDEWTQLIDKSFAYLQLDPDANEPLKGGAEQALWNNFFRFQLTNHVIDATEPESFNFSCKDGIDRGGASSFVYNLHMADNHNAPLDQTEIKMARDVAAIQVKNRPANHHGNIMDAYKEYVKPFRMLELAQKNLAEDKTDNAEKCLQAIDEKLLQSSGLYTESQINKITNQVKSLTAKIDAKKINEKQNASFKSPSLGS